MLHWRWSERCDSNARPIGPKPIALPLRNAPKMVMLQWDSNPHGGWAAIATVFGENLDCRDDRLRVAVFLPFCLPSFIIQHHRWCPARDSNPHYGIRNPAVCPVNEARRKMERAMGFGPTTSSLEGWRSTAELHPQNGLPTGTCTRTSGLLPGILFTRPLLASTRHSPLPLAMGVWA